MDLQDLSLEFLFYQKYVVHLFAPVISCNHLLSSSLYYNQMTNYSAPYMRDFGMQTSLHSYE